MRLTLGILSFTSSAFANYLLRRQGALPPPATSSLSEFPTAPAPTSVSTASGAGPGPLPTGSSAKCGKGYTYCGYMLQQGGHNFAPELVNKTYCDGIEGNCANGVPKTHPDQAVFLCMDDNPASIQLFCACGGKCLNEQQSNNIAHCDAPCVNNCGK
ncbi:hypothetical protein BJ170DRAFT_102869 [Xylariales sp. AK1849]|nr:hypothetical protein BJ170DRAFT_102869 [Xylariales sp. AK1849]